MPGTGLGTGDTEVIKVVAIFMELLGGRTDSE